MRAGFFGRTGRLVAAAIVGTPTLVACNANDPSALARVATVALSPQDTMLVIPDSSTVEPLGFRYRVELAERDGTAITGDRVIEWESTNPLIARVSSGGWVTPVEAGSVQIRARSGGATGVATLLVQEP